MKIPSKKESLCTGIFGGKGLTERRLADALGAVSDLSDYRKLLLEVQQMSEEARKSCPGLAASITDRAFDAEVSGRILIKHALDSVNELRDEGSFYGTFEKVARDFFSDGTQGFFEKLRKESSSIRERCGDAVADLLDEAAKAVETLGINFSHEGDTLLVHRKKGPQGEDVLRLATKRQLGQSGRVSSTEFFGGRNDLAFVTHPILYTPVDCHHRPIFTHTDIAADMDIYAAIIGALGTTKGLLYEHARRVAELGPRGLRGEAPVVIAVLVAVVVGATLVVAGREYDIPLLSGIGYGVIIIAAAVAAIAGGAVVVAAVGV
jgi:hypothetical protein